MSVMYTVLLVTILVGLLTASAYCQYKARKVSEEVEVPQHVKDEIDQNMAWWDREFDALMTKVEGPQVSKNEDASWRYGAKFSYVGAAHGGKPRVLTKTGESLTHSHYNKVHVGSCTACLVYEKEHREARGVPGRIRRQVKIHQPQPMSTPDAAERLKEKIKWRLDIRKLD